MDWQKARAAEAVAKLQEPGNIWLASLLWRRVVHESSHMDVTNSSRKRPKILGMVPWQGLAGAAGAEGQVRMPVGQLHARMVGHACSVSGGVVM